MGKSTLEEGEGRRRRGSGRKKEKKRSGRKKELAERGRRVRVGSLAALKLASFIFLGFLLPFPQFISTDSRDMRIQKIFSIFPKTNERRKGGRAQSLRWGRRETETKRDKRDKEPETKSQRHRDRDEETLRPRDRDPRTNS